MLLFPRLTEPGVSAFQSNVTMRSKKPSSAQLSSENTYMLLLFCRAARNSCAKSRQDFFCAPASVLGNKLPCALLTQTASL